MSHAALELICKNKTVFSLYFFDIVHAKESKLFKNYKGKKKHLATAYKLLCTVRTAYK